MNLREEDNTDENDEILRDLTTITMFSNYSSTNEKIFVLVDMKSSFPSQTVGFLPQNNQEIPFSPPSTTNFLFNTLSFSFRTRSNVSTLVQFDRISLNIDVDGYLALVDRDKQVQRLLVNDEQKPINDGHLYIVHLQRVETKMFGWIIKDRQNPPSKVSIDYGTTPLNIEKFMFGARNQLIGCIENVTFNGELISTKHLPIQRQQCPSSSIVLKSREIPSNDQILIDQMISFKEYDRPLVIQSNSNELLTTFSFSFYTQEANSMIGSLTDPTYQQFLTLSLQNKYLLITIENHPNQRTKIYSNTSIVLSDGREHRISLKFIDQQEILIEIDGHSIGKNPFRPFPVQRIYIGQLDGFLKDKFNDYDGDYFIGCLKDVMFNDRPVVKLEHIHHIERLTNVCPLSKRGRK